MVLCQEPPYQELNWVKTYGNLGVLGERSDPLLDRTITYMLTGGRATETTSKGIISEEIYNSKLASPTSNNMYVAVPSEFNPKHRGEIRSYWIRVSILRIEIQNSTIYASTFDQKPKSWSSKR